MQITIKAGTEPSTPKRYEEPRLVERAARLILTGPSALGSHAIRSMVGCGRAYAIQKELAPGGPQPIPSDRSNRVIATSDAIADAFVSGPVGLTSAGDNASRGQTVYMIRGSLAHVALAHAFVRASLKRKEPTVVAGVLVDGAPDLWYTPEEAVEIAALLSGTQSYTFALPAARRLLPTLVEWAETLVEAEYVVAVETQIAWHLDAPFAYTARLDLTTKSRDSGLYYATDYKTSADPAKDRTRYEHSAQFMGQDTLGSRWVGKSWGGVRVALIPDRGEGPTGLITLWRWPRAARTGDLAFGVRDAQSRIAPYLGKRSHEWPANPLFCSSCPAHVRRVCASR